ncbi:MAG: CBS domain-containing protein [Actinophytocola sp.]|uniref:CBS domain-containing protein n=1 Tax=Actinophytocola sp. TaxID=1872138 RepID=UPI003C76CB85
MSHRKISSVMSTDVATVREGTPFKDIVRVLEQRDISAVPVVDATTHVLGVVSEADLLVRQGEGEPGQTPERKWWRRHHETPRDPRAEGTAAAALMTKPAITVTADATIAHAAREITKHNVKRLPVVDDDGRLVGIVSRKDLLTVFLRKDEDIRDDIIRDVFQIGLGMRTLPDTVRVGVHDGQVTLDGRLELKSQVSLAEQLARHTDGVVKVIATMTFHQDDTGRHTPSMGVDITHEPPPG